MSRAAPMPLGPVRDRRAPGALLLGLATAVPPLQTRQEELGEQMAGHWRLRGAALHRWRRIIAGSGIDTRHGLMPVEDVLDLTTGERMRLYEQHAPPLAHEAAAQAIREAGIAPLRITDLIVISCTGFSAPGVDTALIGALGLRRDVRRLNIGFHGCFGAISGLRTAATACAAQADAAALIVCVELCSLHVRRDAGIDNQIATALFADGAAAAVVAGVDAANACGGSSRAAGARGWRRCAAGPPGGLVLASLDRGHSLLLPQPPGPPGVAEWMSWRVRDAGFAMTLSRAVPDALREAIGDFVDEAGAAGRESPADFIIHPGGPGILDAVSEALACEDRPGLAASRAVLREFGNVSSGTVLFALAEAMRRGCQPPVMLLAFGPGLTIEGITLDEAPAQSDQVE